MVVVGRNERWHDYYPCLYYNDKRQHMFCADRNRRYEANFTWGRAGERNACLVLTDRTLVWYRHDGGGKSNVWCSMRKAGVLNCVIQMVEWI